MIYDTEYKSDLASGASIYVKVPEAQVDYKALYTIQKDPPDFLLPFHYRNVDGEVEFAYETEPFEAFESLWGAYSSKGYTEIWHSLLYPLLDCGEWFLKPYSFALNVEKLYRDAGKATIRYMYVPSVWDCSDFFALKEMVTAFASRISVHDPKLELKVLRAVMNDFNPKTFVQMLRPYTPISPPAAKCAQKETPELETRPPQTGALSHLFCDEKDSDYDTHSAETENADDIFINLPDETDASKSQNKPKKQKETLMDMGIPNDKKQKRAARKPKPKSDSFFHRLRNAGKDIVIER